jgi:hypothetical protein
VGHDSVLVCSRVSRLILKARSVITNGTRSKYLSKGTRGTWNATGLCACWRVSSPHTTMPAMAFYDSLVRVRPLGRTPLVCRTRNESAAKTGSAIGMLAPRASRSAMRAYFFGVSGGKGGSGWLPNSMRTAGIPEGASSTSSARLFAGLDQFRCFRTPGAAGPGSSPCRFAASAIRSASWQFERLSHKRVATLTARISQPNGPVFEWNSLSSHV